MQEALPQSELSEKHHLGIPECITAHTGHLQKQGVVFDREKT